MQRNERKPRLSHYCRPHSQEPSSTHQSPGLCEWRGIEISQIWFCASDRGEPRAALAKFCLSASLGARSSGYLLACLPPPKQGMPWHDAHCTSDAVNLALPWPSELALFSTHYKTAPVSRQRIFFLILLPYPATYSVPAPYFNSSITLIPSFTVCPITSITMKYSIALIATGAAAFVAGQAPSSLPECAVSLQLNCDSQYSYSQLPHHLNEADSIHHSKPASTPSLETTQSSSAPRATPTASPVAQTLALVFVIVPPSLAHLAPT
jgi:hypothetical protein